MDIRPHPEESKKVVVRLDSENEKIHFEMRASRNGFFALCFALPNLALDHWRRIEYPTERTVSRRKLANFVFNSTNWAAGFPEHSSYAIFRGRESLEHDNASNEAMIDTIQQFNADQRSEGYEAAVAILAHEAQIDRPPVPEPVTVPEPLWGNRYTDG